jgi:hypothetical protein
MAALHNRASVHHEWTSHSYLTQRVQGEPLAQADGVMVHMQGPTLGPGLMMGPVVQQAQAVLTTCSLSEYSGSRELASGGGMRNLKP